MQSSRAIASLLVVASLCALGCRSRLNRQSDSNEGSPKTEATSLAALNPVASNSPAKVSPPVRSLRPVGKPHAVEPGMGLGPIMFGATVPTIERHMGMKCEELTDTRCRIISAGVEFELANGVVSAIQIHRFDRPVDGDGKSVWGVFAGGIPPNVLMAMVPEAVIEGIGKPKQTVEVKEKNQNNTVRRDTYDGMVLEYDFNPETRRLMLGGIRIIKKG